MGGTKQQLGVVTMAYQDYFFLQRWYDYYCAQVGSRNLFVFSHGNDPRHRDIAQGANVINLPRDATMFKFDRRRWRMLGHFASGMLEFYDWMIVADVDEIVIVDPGVSRTLGEHMSNVYGSRETAPRNISPLCLELIHRPDLEPLAITPDATILSRRRIFRPNRNYSKPCLVGAPVAFGPGGHRNTLGPRHLPDDLYTLHLKFFDRDTMERVASARRHLVQEAERAGAQPDGINTWNNTIRAYEAIVAQTTLDGENIALPELRAAMARQYPKYTDQYLWGPATTDKLYRIPERFADTF